MALVSIHPFPARMAPELARRSLARVPEGGRVLDPMCGSGTVARAAVEAGLYCDGIDIDPLAVLMARVWTTPLNIERICVHAADLVQVAKELPDDRIKGPMDLETERFISFWFASAQQEQLARLSTALSTHSDVMRDALAIALSRIIVSKEMMASLARDTSHSRPHKVANENDFDVYAGFLRSARLLSRRHQPELIQAKATVQLGDARSLEHLEEHSYDLVMTSPPYLNAIDYLRGHRLALVWLGHLLGDLRRIRAVSVGAERVKTEAPLDVSAFVAVSSDSAIANCHWGWIRRYACDMDAMLRQVIKVIKRSGRAVLVIGNSFLRGATVKNADLIEELAARIGYQLIDKSIRDIPARRRYLPPPGDGNCSLDSRMRTETVLTFGLA